ncbi:uncharacterized protein [Mobula birostris]|uniref:uncharacterized protein isoform X2 n=1 Tax=Mobula birostris TaxID=1983395 RepID=UPI003B280D4F
MKGRPGAAGGAEGRPAGCPTEADGPYNGGTDCPELLHTACPLPRDGDEAAAAGIGPTPEPLEQGFGPEADLAAGPTPGTPVSPVIRCTVEDGAEPKPEFGTSPLAGNLVQDGVRPANGPGVVTGSGPTSGILVELGPGLGPTQLILVEAAQPPPPGFGLIGGGPGILAPQIMGPRRRGRGLRNSFTILERSQALASPETRGLPIITWGGGAYGDPSGWAEPGQGAQGDPILRDESGEDGDSTYQGAVPDQEACQDPTFGAEAGREAEGDLAESQAGREPKGDPTDAQEDPCSGCDSGQGRPVCRRLTYVIKSRGEEKESRSLREGESQGEVKQPWPLEEAEGQGEVVPRGEGEAEAPPQADGPKLTSFAEQKQLRERRPRWGPQAVPRRSAGSRPCPEWAQVRRGLELKQEEIRARLEAREARLGRRWQSLGRRAYCRLLKLTGRGAEAEAQAQAQAQAKPEAWDNTLAAAQAQLQELGLQDGRSEWAGRGRVRGAEPAPEAGRVSGDWAPGEAATASHCRAEKNLSTAAWKLLRSGGQESERPKVDSPDWLGPSTLDPSGDRSLRTGQQETTPRQRRGEGRRERLLTRPRADGDGGSVLPPAEPTGLRLYKEPSSKSNRLILHNALTHCCLAGRVNEVQRTQVIQELASCEHAQCLILFRDQHCQFRALYSLSGDSLHIQRLWGIGPRHIHTDMIDRLYKYNSDRKQFHPIPSRIISPNVDALTIHGHLWSARKKSALGSERR